MITKSLNPPTITPNFGQSPVTLDWDKASVASRPGPVRAPDSSAPQPPGARSAGPVEFRVRFNPLMPSGRFGAGPIFISTRFNFGWRSICRSTATSCGRCSQHHTGLRRHDALHDDVESIDVLKRKIAFWDFAKRHGESLRLPFPVTKLYPAAHDVVIGQRAILVFTAPDLHSHFARDWAEPNLAAVILALGGRHIHRHLAVGYIHLHGQRKYR